MRNTRPTEENIVEFKQRVDSRLWYFVLHRVVEEADRLGFDLSQQNGGLEDSWLVLPTLSRSAMTARIEYLWPDAPEEQRKRLIQDAIEDGWADRFREDVLAAWQEVLSERERKPTAAIHLMPSAPVRPRPRWIRGGAVVSFFLAVGGLVYGLFHYDTFPTWLFFSALILFLLSPSAFFQTRVELPSARADQ